jgi:uncharacterized protein (TIGR00251 family)
MIPAEMRERLARDGRLSITLKAIPKASKDEIAGVLGDGSLKVRTTAAPERGKANEAICAVLARELGVARRNVRIVRGGTSQTKQAEIVL